MILNVGRNWKIKKCCKKARTCPARRPFRRLLCGRRLGTVSLLGHRGPQTSDGSASSWFQDTPGPLGEFRVAPPIPHPSTESFDRESGTFRSVPSNHAPFLRCVPVRGWLLPLRRLPAPGWRPDCRNRLGAPGGREMRRAGSLPAIDPPFGKLFKSVRSPFLLTLRLSNRT